MNARFERSRVARIKWSRNAVKKRDRNTIERALSPQSEPPAPVEVRKIKPAKWDVKINLARKDGERIQFTCHRWDNKLMIGGRCIAPKQFGRVLGQIINLWSLK